MTRRQIPRATAAQLDAATFLPGEIAVDTTNDELRYDGDGSTVGGIKIAKKSDVTALQALVANLAESGQVLISRQAASSSATIDFTGLSSTYDRYILQVCSAKPATDDVALELRVGTGAGPSYQTSNYYWGNTNMRGTTTFAGGSASDVALFVSGLSGGGAGVGNAAGENIQTTIEFSNPDSADFMQVSWRSTFMRADGTSCTVVGGGCYNVAGAITAVRLLFSSGNIASGDFILLGVRHAN